MIKILLDIKKYLDLERNVLFKNYPLSFSIGF